MTLKKRWMAGICSAAFLASTPVWAQYDSPFQVMDNSAAAETTPETATQSGSEAASQPTADPLAAPEEPAAEQATPADPTPPDMPEDEEGGWSIGGFIGSIFGTPDGTADNAPTNEGTSETATDSTSENAFSTAPEQNDTAPNMYVPGASDGENAFLSRINGPRTHIGGWENPDQKSYSAPAENNTMDEMRRAMQMRSN